MSCSARFGRNLIEVPIKVIKKRDRMLVQASIDQAKPHLTALDVAVDGLHDRLAARVIYTEVMSIAHRLSRRHGFSLRKQS